jgi:glycosyltransferase involved in cell wall biosynthesis
MDAQSTVAVIIPVINEEKALPHVLAALAAVHSGPVLVVDGGSTDDTVAAAQQAGASVLVEPRRGYGRACMAGAERAIADGAGILVFMDGDHSYDPVDLPGLLRPLLSGRADIVIGARNARWRAPGAMAAHQSAGNDLVALLIRLVYGVPITDPGTFRAMRAIVFQSLALREMTYGWPVEAIARGARLGYRIVEVPVSYRPRIGTSKVSGTLRGSVLAGHNMVRAIFRYR